MTHISRRPLLRLLATGVSFAIVSFAVNTAKAQSASADQKQAAIKLVSAFETGDTNIADIVDAKRYVEHDPGIKSGIAGLEAAIQGAAKAGAKRRVVRALQDGEYVVLHVEQVNGGKSYAAFDVYRFDGAKIVEHWSNVQEMGKPNPSGRTLLDGTTEISKTAQSEETKRVAGNFVKEVLQERKLERFGSYVDGENYIQHNPMFADGLKAVTEGFKKATEAGIVFKLDKIHKVLGEGNFAFIMGEGSINGAPTAFFDLFRVENAKLAEHWDVIERIPAQAERQNDNGKF